MNDHRPERPDPGRTAGSELHHPLIEAPNEVVQQMNVAGQRRWNKNSLLRMREHVATKERRPEDSARLSGYARGRPL
jgi:hypothetical protein